MIVDIMTYGKEHPCEQLHNYDPEGSCERSPQKRGLFAGLGKLLIRNGRFPPN